MDRKRFLKLFGLGAAGIATVKIVIEETKKPFVTDGYTVNRPLRHGVRQEGYAIDVSTLPDNYDIDKLIKEYELFQESGLINIPLQNCFSTIRKI